MDDADPPAVHPFTQQSGPMEPLPYGARPIKFFDQMFGADFFVDLATATNAVSCSTPAPHCLQRQRLRRAATPTPQPAAAGDKEEDSSVTATATPTPQKILPSLPPPPPPRSQRLQETKILLSLPPPPPQQSGYPRRVIVCQQYSWSENVCP